MIDEFTRRNPEIRVRTLLSGPDPMQQMLTFCAGGKSPDVLMAWEQTYASLADRGVLLDLNTLLDRDPAFAADPDRGVRLLHAGQIDEAIRELQASRADPRHHWKSLLYLGYCFKNRNNWRLAERNFAEALKDLPAGGARLYCKAEGISRVIVNGETIYLEGKPTSARPGQVLRSM